MKLFLTAPLLASLPLAIARGKNKPGYFDYNCSDICDYEGVKRWIKQACEGIGGSSTTENGAWYNQNGKIVGGHAICLCARGQTSPHDYTISGDYPPGTATLKFNADKGPYTCQRSG